MFVLQDKTRKPQGFQPKHWSPQKQQRHLESCQSYSRGTLVQAPYKLSPFCVTTCHLTPAPVALSFIKRCCELSTFVQKHHWHGDDGDKRSDTKQSQENLPRCLQAGQIVDN